MVDTMTCVDPVINEAYLAEKGAARGMYRQCMEQAIAFIGRAKRVHDGWKATIFLLWILTRLTSAGKKPCTGSWNWRGAKNTYRHFPKNRDYQAVFFIKII
jgi:hypothetical protein